MSLCLPAAARSAYANIKPYVVNIGSVSFVRCFTFTYFMCKGMDFLQFFFVAFVVKTERVIDNKLTPPHNNDIKVFPNELDNYFNSHIENMNK